MCCATAFTFQSCGSDGDEPDDYKPTENVNEFVGAWKGSSETIVFFNDACVKEISSRAPYFGKWTYNESTKILATTIGGDQWVVTLTGKDAWAGYTVTQSSAVSFDACDAVETAYAIMKGSDCTRDGETERIPCEMTSDYDGRPGSISGSRPYISALRLGNGYIRLETDENSNSSKFKYSLYTQQSKVSGYNRLSWFQLQETGVATFKDMYSASKCTLELVSETLPEDDSSHKRVYTIDNTDAKK